MLLVALDNSETPVDLTSEMGIELMNLKIHDNPHISLNPTNVKNIIVAAEDTSIALRLSELASEIIDNEELERRSAKVQRLRLNLLSGQQCIRYRLEQDTS